MPIRTALDLSTAHMKSTDNELLGRYSSGPNGRKRPANGCLIVDRISNTGFEISTAVWNDRNASERERILEAARAEGFSEEFITILRHAAASQLWAVRFDADAEFELAFPRFDWEAGDTLIVEEDETYSPTM